jgi:2-oxoisovalerate dehydrogenase E1 component
MPKVESLSIAQDLSFEDFKKEVLSDFHFASISREASLLGRKEVLTGKAKFGIFGDGKEVAQIAMAKHFRNGDFRSGYYRDQTFMMATGNLTVKNTSQAFMPTPMWKLNRNRPDVKWVDTLPRVV